MTHRLEDTGGAISTATAGILWLAKKINIAEVNNYLIAVTSILGAIWVVHRIIGQRLNNEGQRLDNELKRKNKEDESRDN